MFKYRVTDEHIILIWFIFFATAANIAVSERCFFSLHCAIASPDSLLSHNYSDIKMLTKQQGKMYNLPQALVHRDLIWLRPSYCLPLKVPLFTPFMLWSAMYISPLKSTKLSTASQRSIFKEFSCHLVLVHHRNSSHKHFSLSVNC